MTTAQAHQLDFAPAPSQTNLLVISISFAIVSLLATSYTLVRLLRPLVPHRLSGGSSAAEGGLNLSSQLSVGRAEASAPPLSSFSADSNYTSYTYVARNGNKGLAWTTSHDSSLKKPEHAWDEHSQSRASTDAVHPSLLASMRPPPSPRVRSAQRFVCYLALADQLSVWLLTAAMALVCTSSDDVASRFASPLLFSSVSAFLLGASFFGRATLLCFVGISSWTHVNLGRSLCLGAYDYRIWGLSLAATLCLAGVATALRERTQSGTAAAVVAFVLVAWTLLVLVSLLAMSSLAHTIWSAARLLRRLRMPSRDSEQQAAGHFSWVPLDRRVLAQAALADETARAGQRQQPPVPTLCVPDQAISDGRPRVSSALSQSSWVIQDALLPPIPRHQAAAAAAAAAAAGGDAAAAAGFDSQKTGASSAVASSADAYGTGKVRVPASTLKTVVEPETGEAPNGRSSPYGTAAPAADEMGVCTGGADTKSPERPSAEASPVLAEDADARRHRGSPASTPQEIDRMPPVPLTDGPRVSPDIPNPALASSDSQTPSRSFYGSCRSRPRSPSMDERSDAQVMPPPPPPPQGVESSGRASTPLTWASSASDRAMRGEARAPSALSMSREPGYVVVRPLVPSVLSLPVELATQGGGEDLVGASGAVLSMLELVHRHDRAAAAVMAAPGLDGRCGGDAWPGVRAAATTSSSLVSTCGETEEATRALWRIGSYLAATLVPYVLTLPLLVMTLASPTTSSVACNVCMLIGANLIGPIMALYTAKCERREDVARAAPKGQRQQQAERVRQYAQQRRHQTSASHDDEMPVAGNGLGGFNGYDASAKACYRGARRHVAAAASLDAALLPRLGYDADGDDAPSTTTGYNESRRLSSSHRRRLSVPLSVVPSLAVGSVPYLPQHWQAGRCEGDAVVEVRSAVSRALSLMLPHPRLEVQPQGKEGGALATTVGANGMPGGWQGSEVGDLSLQSVPESVVSSSRAVEGDEAGGAAVVGNEPPTGTPHPPGALRTCPTSASATAPRSHVLDGLSALLLPRLVPGLSIGPNVQVAEDEERTLCETYEAYARDVARSPVWYSFAESPWALRTAARSPSPIVSVTTAREYDSRRAGSPLDRNRGDDAGAGAATLNPTHPPHSEDVSRPTPSAQLRHRRVQSLCSIRSPPSPSDGVIGGDDAQEHSPSIQPTPEPSHCASPSGSIARSSSVDLGTLSAADVPLPLSASTSPAERRLSREMGMSADDAAERDKACAGVCASDESRSRRTAALGSVRRRSLGSELGLAIRGSPQAVVGGGGRSTRDTPSKRTTADSSLSSILSSAESLDEMVLTPDATVEVLVDEQSAETPPKPPPPPQQQHSRGEASTSPPASPPPGQLCEQQCTPKASPAPLLCDPQVEEGEAAVDPAQSASSEAEAEAEAPQLVDLDPLTLHRHMFPAIPLATLDEVTEEPTLFDWSSDLTASLEQLSGSVGGRARATPARDGTPVVAGDVEGGTTLPSPPTSTPVRRPSSPRPRRHSFDTPSTAEHCRGWAQVMRPSDPISPLASRCGSEAAATCGGPARISLASSFSLSTPLRQGDALDASFWNASPPSLALPVAGEIALLRHQVCGPPPPLVAPPTPRRRPDETSSLPSEDSSRSVNFQFDATAEWMEAGSGFEEGWQGEGGGDARRVTSHRRRLSAAALSIISSRRSSSDTTSSLSVAALSAASASGGVAVSVAGSAAGLSIESGHSRSNNDPEQHNDGARKHSSSSLRMLREFGRRKRSSGPLDPSTPAKHDADDVDRGHETDAQAQARAESVGGGARGIVAQPSLSPWQVLGRDEIDEVDEAIRRSAKRAAAAAKASQLTKSPAKPARRTLLAAGRASPVKSPRIARRKAASTSKTNLGGRRPTTVACDSHGAVAADEHGDAWADESEAVHDRHTAAGSEPPASLACQEELVRPTPRPPALTNVEEGECNSRRHNMATAAELGTAAAKPSKQQNSRLTSAHYEVDKENVVVGTGWAAPDDRGASGKRLSVTSPRRKPVPLNLLAGLENEPGSATAAPTAGYVDAANLSSNSAPAVASSSHRPSAPSPSARSSVRRPRAPPRGNGARATTRQPLPEVHIRPPSSSASVPMIHRFR